MSKTKKTLTIILAMVMVAALSVAATLAYLTSTTETVKNTFTVGNVEITLDEAPVDANGDATSGDRGTSNSYKLYPNHEYDKDPTVHVATSSDDCYLFVRVTNGIAAIEAATEDGDDGYKTIADQMAANGWVALEGETGVYFLAKTTSTGDVVTAGTNVVVFSSFKIDADVDGETLASYATTEENDVAITIIAYAVQADGFTSAAAAWEAAFAQ